jgi:antitoxin component YwqK of YwqJK toxin-antitoxin module
MEVFLVSYLNAIEKPMRNYIVFCLMMCFVYSLNAQDQFNQLDQKGAKHGVWKGYHPESKRLRYEGTFNHGKEVGMFKFFDDTQAGTVIATREFNPADQSVYTIFYDQKSNKVSEGKSVNKQNEGVWKYYHFESKALMSVENYKKGKLEGTRTVYYADSKPAEEAQYANGLKKGTYKKWANNGVVLEEAIYDKDQYEGQAIYRDPLGNIVAKGLYKKGKKVGMWQFYEGGKLVSEENMSAVKKASKSAKK